MVSPPPHAATYVIPYVNDLTTKSVAVLTEELDTNQSWFTGIQGTTTDDIIVIQAPSAGLLSFTDPKTIVIDATAFAALRSVYSIVPTDPFIAKFKITGLIFDSSLTCNNNPSYFNPASYLNATNAGQDNEEASASLLTNLTLSLNTPVSIMSGETLGIVDTSQKNGATIYCYLADGSNVPLSWAYAKLLFGNGIKQSQLVTVDPNFLTWPLSPPNTLYVDMQVQAADNPTSPFSNELSDEAGTMTMVYSDATGEVTVAPQAGIPLGVDSQRVVWSVPTAATAKDAQPQVSLTAGGAPVAMWTGQQQGQASPDCSITITPLSTAAPLGQNQLSNTIMLTTGLPNGTSEVNITTPNTNPAILQVGIATFNGNASGSLTGISIDGTPQIGPFQDLGGGQWSAQAPVTSGQHTYLFQSSDGGTSDPLIVTGVDISVQTKTAQNTPPDTLTLPITQNSNPLAMDSLVLNAAITGIEAFGSPVDVEWQLNVQTALPIRAWVGKKGASQRPPIGPGLGPPQHPPDQPLTSAAYWIGFSALVTDTVNGVSSSTQTWNPPYLQLDIDSVQGDIGDQNPDQSQITAIAATYKDADVQSIGLTGKWVSSVSANPVQAGPIIGTAILGANILQNGVTICVLKYNEFFIVGNDIQNFVFQDFFQYLTYLFGEIFDIGGGTTFLGLTVNELATLFLAILQDESHVEQFQGPHEKTSALYPEAPDVAQQEPDQSGVVFGPPAGVGIGQVDLEGSETVWTGNTLPPPQGPLSGNGAPPQCMFAICFDWQSNLQLAVRTFYEKCLHFYGENGENIDKLIKWVDKAEITRLNKLNVGVPDPDPDTDLAPFNASLRNTPSYILRCCVKLYNGGSPLKVITPNPSWETACPYESTLTWNPGAPGEEGQWVSGQNAIVEGNFQPNPPPLPQNSPPWPAGWITNGHVYDEPYSAKVFAKYSVYVANGIQNWGDL